MAAGPHTVAVRIGLDPIAGLERAQSRMDRLEVQPAPAPGGEQIADAAPEVTFRQLGGADIRIAAVGAQEPIERVTGGVAGVTKRARGGVASDLGFERLAQRE